MAACKEKISVIVDRASPDDEEFGGHQPGVQGQRGQKDERDGASKSYLWPLFVTHTVTKGNLSVFKNEIRAAASISIMSY